MRYNMRYNMAENFRQLVLNVWSDELSCTAMGSLLNNELPVKEKERFL